MKHSLHRNFAVIAVLALFVAILPLGSLTTGAQSYPHAYPECSDGIDNDNDGHIDYQQDDGCQSPSDPTEGANNHGLFMSLSDGKASVDPGGNLSYTITLQNDRDDVKYVDVRFMVPHQTNMVSASDSGRQEGINIVWRHVPVNPQQPTPTYT